MIIIIMLSIIVTDAYKAERGQRCSPEFLGIFEMIKGIKRFPTCANGLYCDDDLDICVLKTGKLKGCEPNRRECQDGLDCHLGYKVCMNQTMVGSSLLETILHNLLYGAAQIMDFFFLSQI